MTTTMTPSCSPLAITPGERALFTLNKQIAMCNLLLREPEARLAKLRAERVELMSRVTAELRMARLAAAEA
jgi:hypothetical protein